MPRRGASVRAAALFLGLCVAATAACSTDAARQDGKRPASRAPEPAQEVREDFNGDGYEDLAVGAPGWRDRAGYVAVVYGSADGLDPATAHVLDQDTAGVPGEAAPGDGFGEHLVARDLDGDGLTDLAVTSDGEETKNPRGSGTVTLLWGSSQGVTGAEAALLAPTKKGLWGAGSHLTGGDFDGDGSADLFTYRPDGGVGVLGGPFTRDGDWAHEKPVEVTGSGLGSVAAGDMNGDGADDLVLFHAFEEMAEPAAFHAGGPDGLTKERDLPEGANGVVADFDGDGYGDLAYRHVPEGVVENLAGDSGTVKVIHGGPDGPSSRTASFTQATPGVPGANEVQDQFGGALAARDVDGDDHADLAVGVPYEDIGGRQAAGAFVVLRGGADGLSGDGAQAMSQDFAGVPGVAEAGDRFGATMRLLDFDADGAADLAVAAPDEDDGSGAVWTFPGGPDGVTTGGVGSFGPAAVGRDAEEEEFGRTLTGAPYSPLWSPPSSSPAPGDVQKE